MRTLSRKLAGLKFRDKLLVAALGPLVPMVASGLVGLYSLFVLVGTQEALEELGRHRVVAKDLLAHVIDAETSERGYVITGDPRFLTLYEESSRRVPRLVLDLADLTRSEPIQAARARRVGELFARWRDQVAEPILEARRLVPGPLPVPDDRRDLMGSIARRISLEEGKLLTDDMRRILAEFDGFEARQGLEQLRAGRRAGAIALGFSLVAFLVALALAAWSAWTISLRASRTLTSLAEGAEKVAAGDLDQRARVSGEDEVADVARAFNRMTDRMRRRRAEGDLRHQFAELVQASASLDEAFAIFARMAPRLLPSGRGALYLLDASRRDVSRVAAFGNRSEELAENFLPDDCWAVRRARAHSVRDGVAPLCAHAAGDPPCSLCAPLANQGEVFGVFHFEVPAEEWRLPEADDLLVLAGELGTELALALGNLRLRDTLRNQSIRDPLTGLYNRRYFDDIFERELQRALRSERPLSLMLLDLDHFKRFNDSFGHEAGDLVLKEVGTLLRQVFRAGDVPCRLGGEEFAVLLPDAAPTDVRPRAEELATRLRNRDLRLRKQELGRVTISAGVAGAPEHGRVCEELMRAADLALYAAKRGGRDRMLIAV